MSDHITISPASVSALCDDCKSVLAQLLGFGLVGGNKPTSGSGAFEEEVAELGIQAARLFLQGCNDKTRATLERIVEAGEQFSLRAVERAAGVGPSELRGVWAGLTKRVRTITGDPDANLVDWSDETDEGDYIGRLHPLTRRSFERALAE